MLLKAGFRPAALLLHTPEADAALLRAADEHGVTCKKVPPLRTLRESFRSFWDSGIPPLFGHVISSWSSLEAFLVLGGHGDASPVLPCSVLGIDLFRHKGSCTSSSAYTNLVPSQVLNRIQMQAQLETLGFQNSLAVVQTIEQHLQQRSPLHTHCSASSAVTKAESSREVLDAWLHDTQHCNGFQTGGFGGDKNVVRCTMWENKLWQSSYVLDKCIDGSQALISMQI